MSAASPRWTPHHDQPITRSTRIPMSKISRQVSALAATVALVATASVASAAGGGATGADLQVTGSSSTRSPSFGAPFSYTFQIKNSGPDTASAVSFRDPLPLATGYVSATVNGSTGPCTMANGVVTCSLGTLVRGAQASVVINVTAPSIVGTFANSGTVTASTPDPQPGNNTDTVNVQISAGGGALPPPTVLTGPIYLRDSFGFDPPIDGLPFRYDSAGNRVAIYGAGGEVSMNQLRVEWPNTAPEVWLTPAVRQSPTWYFGP